MAAVVIVFVVVVVVVVVVFDTLTIEEPLFNGLERHWEDAEGTDKPTDETVSNASILIKIVILEIRLQHLIFFVNIFLLGLIIGFFKTDMAFKRCYIKLYDK